LLLKNHEEPDEAEEGQGEVVMTEASDLVQSQLSELAQQVMHVIQACNEEKEIIEDDFESVKNNIRILETRIQTERQRIDSDVSGVSFQMEMQQAMLKELRFGIHILQSQDSQIVEEAGQLFQGIRAEMEAMSKRITANSIQLLANQNRNKKIQEDIQGLTLGVENVNKTLSKIRDSLKEIPSKQELRNHAVLMDEQTMKIQEVNTGLTTAMEGFKVSELSRFNFRQELPRVTPFQQVGPSTTVHPERQRYFGSDASSLRDTESEVSWLGGLRGGAGSEIAGDAGRAAGSDGGAGGAAGGDGEAGGAAGGAGGAGGASGGAGDPPPPGSGPPSDHNNNNNNNNNRLSRRQRRIQELQYAKPIKIKEPKRFEGKIGDDFEVWWMMMEVYIQNQPEKFPNDKRTIDWIGSLMDKYAAAWHVQWIKGTINGKHPTSITGYVQALKLRFEDRDDKDEAYA